MDPIVTPLLLALPGLVRLLTIEKMQISDELKVQLAEVVKVADKIQLSEKMQLAEAITLGDINVSIQIGANNISVIHTSSGADRARRHHLVSLDPGHGTVTEAKTPPFRFGTHVILGATLLRGEANSFIAPRVKFSAIGKTPRSIEFADSSSRIFSAWVDADGKIRLAGTTDPFQLLEGEPPAGTPGAARWTVRRLNHDSVLALPDQTDLVVSVAPASKHRSWLAVRESKVKRPQYFILMDENEDGV